jgi:hypothetical protein
MQLKKIALAVAAAATMVSSFAAVNTTNAPELVFIAWNDKGTFGKDLGVTLDSLTKTTTFAVAGSNWTSFLGLNGAGTQWMVASFSSINDGFSVDDRVLKTTINSIAAPVSMDNLGLNDGGNTISIKWAEMSIVGGNVANHEMFASLGSLGDVNDVNANYATLGDRLPTGSAVGQTASFFRYATSSDDSALMSTLTDLSAPATHNTANFTGTTLTVTAVPEPTTYAMLIAGLLGIGFMVRRRNV